MFSAGRLILLLLVTSSALGTSACKEVELTPPICAPLVTMRYGGLWIEGPVAPQPLDLLFVIDNSSGMAEAQNRLRRAFAQLLVGLDAKTLPGLRIGVVTTNLGAGNYSLPGCEVTGGDGGRLQNTPRVAGCTAPLDPWISYLGGHTNIPGCSGDGLACVLASFDCIAALGAMGCGFEAPLEAARRALDPKLNANPGFLRDDARLAVIFLTNEDDCSVRNPGLFDPTQQRQNDPLGPLTSFRCFEFGVQCDITDRNQLGPRAGCQPAFDWLHPVDDYITFFERLKPSKDRVTLAAISGAREPVVVGLFGGFPALEPSCQSAGVSAVPPIRLAHVVDALGGEVASICADDYGPALERIGQRIVEAPAPPCTPRLAMLPNEGVATDGFLHWMLPCDASLGQRCDPVRGECMQDGKSTGRICGESWRGAVCSEVEQTIPPGGPYLRIERCPAKYFNASIAQDQCGADCPCWRTVPALERCAVDEKHAPYQLEIMRAEAAPPGSVTRARCHAACWRSPQS